ncbi:MAG: hypothetical protein ACRDIY_07375 [Chloroflexota bacterium]
MKKLIGIYLPASVVNEDPGYLEALQRSIGLTHVLLSSRQVRLSAATLALNPFRRATDPHEVLAGLVCRGLDGGIPGNLAEAHPEPARWGPSVAFGDDSALRRAIDALRAGGLTAWYVGGAWTANSLMFCPSKEPVNAWLEAVYRDVAESYDVEAIDVTHARYPKFAFVDSLFQCACPDCASSAADLGYDLPWIANRLRHLIERLGEVSADELRAVARESAGPLDLLQVLPDAVALGSWLNFRCDLIARNLRRFHRAVRDTGRPVLFGSDTYPPALAALFGHRYREWSSHSDFSSPLLAHIFAFVTQGFASWTRFLQDRIDGLSESDALGLLYRITGYAGLGMPDTIEALGLDRPDGEFHQVPIVGLMERDLEKSRRYASPGIPSYPIIQGGVWPVEVVRGLIAAAERLGHDGIIFQGSGSLLEYRGRA